MKEPWHKGLTEKQRRFVEAYTANGGNATHAARDAGYKAPHVQGCRVLENVSVKNAVEKVRESTTNEGIATRTERQQFWTRMMNDKSEGAMARMKASELLGKSQGDFVDRKEISGPEGGAVKVEALTDEQLLNIASKGS